MSDNTVPIDAVVVGGGVTGLWVLNVLRSRGYSAILLEAGCLGGDQTLASQGIIHGGLKYALGGAPTAASEAARQASGHWRACMAGRGQIDLRPLKPVSDGFYLFSGNAAVGKLSAFLAGKALRGPVERLARGEFPEALRNGAFRGWVYRLEDFALDIPALLARLAVLAAGGIYRYALASDSISTDQNSATGCGGMRVRLGDHQLLVNRLILAAGTGNEALMRGLGIVDIPMQRPVLHQVIVRHPELPSLFGHWLGAGGHTEPRLTITTHYDGERQATPQHRLWYLGGQLATSGGRRDAQTQCQRAKAELETCFPWMDWSGAAFAALGVDRAERRQSGGGRPDQASVEASGACIVCWPTKLTLVPELASRVLEWLPPPQFPSPGHLNLPIAELGKPPWEA